MEPGKKYRLLHDHPDGAPRFYRCLFVRENTVWIQACWPDGEDGLSEPFKVGDFTYGYEEVA